ncbi:MAG: DUF1553 domain-containing protein [Acidimicrobiia bacterium]|nr:DUF1553 domain-containing protein [Acidimicrobiia bacterium]
MHLAFTAVLLLAPALSASAQVSFHTQIRPLLDARCLPCHQGAQPAGALDMSSYETLPERSLLLAAISGTPPRMPKAGPPLSPAEINLIKTWISEGAPNDTPATFKQSTWWSLTPLQTTAPPQIKSPWIRSPIDNFILAKLHANNLTHSPEADRRTLIRRLTYNLHGLPPTWEQTQAFLNDNSPDAYEKLIDTLLASSRYGERWGRHWLDVVHYGESHGYDKDKPRRNAWPYRDYVIQSLNNDKPYAQFIKEQIAADILYPGDPAAIPALGFLAAGPWDFVGHVELREDTVDKKITRLLDRDDMLMTVMSSLNSATVHCARCHDHKFDPIPQEDYYSLQAVFAGVDRADRPFDNDPATHRARLPLLAERRAILAQLQPLLDDKTTAKGPEATRLRSLLEELDARIAALPKPNLVYAAASYFPAASKFRFAVEPRPVHVLARGNVEAPLREAVPGALTAVKALPARFADTTTEASRRAALAEWITHRDNPLTWRSAVNRAWHYHLGAGIVETPNDFGRMGSLPSHPELLDWLAAWFRDNGGSFKKLHRMILLSATYRQSSAPDAAKSKLDSENRLLWRMNRARLDAESLRDSALMAAGQLDLTMGGPSAEQFYFKDDHSPVYDYALFDIDSPASRRRSVYRFIVRSVPDPLMERLDCPDPSLMTGKRNTTITAIQALALLNNPLIVRQAEHLADRVQRITQDPAAQIQWLYRLTLSRDPSPNEARLLAAYLHKHGLRNTSRVLINSNEFLFVD